MAALSAFTLSTVNRHIERQTREESMRALETAQAVFENSLQIRERNLLARVENAVNEPRFRSTVMLDDVETTRAFLRDALDEYLDEVAILVYTSASDLKAAGAARSDEIDLAGFSRAVLPEVEASFESGPQSSLLVQGSKLYEVVSVPVTLPNKGPLLGSLSIGSEIGQQAVEEIRSLTRTEVSILFGERTLVSSLSDQDRDRVFLSFVEGSGEEAAQAIMLKSGHYHLASGSLEAESDSMEGSRLRYVLLDSYEGRLTALAATRQLLLWVSLIGLGLSGGVVWFLIARLTGPLRSLRDGALSVEAGDYSRRVDVVSADECGALANAFNNMMDSVQSSRTRLMDTVRELEETQEDLVERELRLRESEAGLNLIIDGARDHAIFTINDEGRVLRWNNASERMLLYSAQEANALHYEAFFDSEEAEGAARYTDVLEEARREGVAQFEGWRIRKDGTRMWADVTVSRLEQLEGSENGGFVEIARDITARRQLEETLRSARDAAEASDRAKSEFLANMSHEVRTPMNGIIGMSSLLLDSDIGEEPREFAQTIRGCADSMLAVLDDILDIAKIESGHLELEFSDVVVSELIEEAVMSFAARCSEEGLQLSLVLPAAMPATLESDPIRLRQLIGSLMSNAVKFTPQGQVAVAVTFDAKMTSFCIEIRDTGIGIAADQFEKIFDPFFQAESSMSRNYGGTGLGLAIVRNVVELLGGSVEVESELGKGSVFRVRHPIKKASESVMLPPLEATPVLVVSDASGMRTHLLDQLTRFGLAVSGTPSTPDALQAALSREAWSCVVGDASLLREDSRKLLQGRADLPPLLMLGDACADDLEKSFGDKGVTALALPLRPSLLHRALKELQGDAKAAPAGKVSHQEKPVEAKKALFDKAFADRYPMRVLVVEDNKINAKLLLKILTKLGYEGTVAPDGEQGYQAAEAAAYDFVFMDLQMPVMNGFDAARHILASEKIKHPIFISAFTANSNQNEEEECAAIGFHSFVSKPARPDKIQNVLKMGFEWLQAEATKS